MTRVQTAAKMLYNWLAQYAPSYRGVLPAGMNPETPYIVYTGYGNNLDGVYTQALNIYELNTTSFAGVYGIADEIEQAIGESGILLHDDSGMHMKIHKGDPYVQDKSDENATTRACMVNLEITTF